MSSPPSTPSMMTEVQQQHAESPINAGQGDANTQRNYYNSSNNSNMRKKIKIILNGSLDMSPTSPLASALQHHADAVWSLPPGAMLHPSALFATASSNPSSLLTNESALQQQGENGGLQQVEGSMSGENTVAQPSEVHTDTTYVASTETTTLRTTSPTNPVESTPSTRAPSEGSNKRFLPPLPAIQTIRRSMSPIQPNSPKIIGGPTRAPSKGMDERASAASRSEREIRDREREKAKDAAAAANANVSKQNSKQSGSGGSLYRAVRVPEKPKTIVEHIRDFFFSLRFFFLGMLIASLVTVSVLSWNLTYQAAKNSIQLVMNDYSDVLLSQITSDLDRRFTAVEHVTTINKNYFKKGLLRPDTPDGFTNLMSHFQVQTQELIVDTISSLSFTTKQGYLNGYGYYVREDGKTYVQWLQNSSVMVENRVDDNGVAIALNFEDPNVDNSQNAWYLAINDTDADSSGFTPPYVFYGTWFISQSSTIVNTKGQILGCVTSDVVLGFLDKIAKQMASSSSVGAQFVIIDSKTGNLLGTSISNFALSDDSDPNNVVGKDLAYPGNPALLTTLHGFIIQSTGRDPASTPDVLYRNMNSFSGEIKVDGTRLLVSVRSFYHHPSIPANASIYTASWNQEHAIDWVLLHCLDRSQVEQEIANSNNKVLISVVCICAAFIVAMGLLLWYSLRLIRSLSKLLTSFARFEFRGHVEGGQLKNRSIFVELRQMQDAVMEMTKAFKQHLDGQAKMFNRGTDRSMSPAMHSSSVLNGAVKVPSTGISTAAAGAASIPPRPANPNISHKSSITSSVNSKTTNGASGKLPRAPGSANGDASSVPSNRRASM